MGWAEISTKQVGTMKGLARVAALVATLGWCGCAGQQTALRPGDDSSELVSAIARRGQGEWGGETPAEAEAHSTGLEVLTQCALVGVVVVGAVCLVLLSPLESLRDLHTKLNHTPPDL
jgi:hypothetical protein